MPSPKKTTETSEIQKKVESIAENFQKEFGEGAVTLLGKSKFKQHQALSTGSLLLDQAIGSGGYV